MFDNVSSKIKALALCIFWGGCIASIIGTIILAANALEHAYSQIENLASLSIKSLLLIIIGPIASYISAIFIYGFGQLIENTDVLFHIYRKLPSYKDDANCVDENKK